MVRTTIIPEDANLNLPIPLAYVGRKIEVLYYPIDELIEEKSFEPPTMGSFRGILTKEEGIELQEYVKKSREEWDRDS